MEENKQCPCCGETIKAEAKKCRYCGEWLAPAPISNTAQVSEATDPDIETEPVTKTDYSWYSRVCSFLILVAILSGFSKLTPYYVDIPEDLLLLCECFLTICVIRGLRKLCHEKGLKNEWIFPCWTGFWVIGCLGSLAGDGTPTFYGMSAGEGLLLLFLLAFYIVIHATIGIIVATKVSLLLGIMLIVNMIVALLTYDMKGESALIGCLADICLFMVWGRVFNRANKVAAPSDEE